VQKECLFLDVFTDTPYSGNQLAVFPEADDLNSETMQKLANEINYSETSFILKSKDENADYEIRIFTIYSEMPFAGHPTLGTAFAIFNILGIWPEDKNILRLKTKVGIIPLEKGDGIIWMKQNHPKFFRQYTNKREIADLVGILPEDIPDDLPVEEVSTGNNIVIVPVTTLSAVKKAQGNVNNLRLFFEDKESIAPYLFTTETILPESRIHSRFFAPHFGIMEDPATGSAAGPLTGYLLKHNVFGSSLEIQNEQGIEMGRASKILMKGERKDNQYTVQIGGLCAYAGKGNFKI
jgi:trans-2,3-dihydro-3-hydroxyanthranilate isomerase